VYIRRVRKSSDVVNLYILLCFVVVTFCFVSVRHCRPKGSCWRTAAYNPSLRY